MTEPTDLLADYQHGQEARSQQPKSETESCALVIGIGTGLEVRT